MKHLTPHIFSASILLSVVTLADQDNSIAYRQECAEEYINKALSVDYIISLTAVTISLDYPKEQRETYEKAVTDALDKDKTREIMVAALSSTFTADELKALTALFGSEAGKSAMKKLSGFAPLLVNRLGSEVKDVVQATKQSLN